MGKTTDKTQDKPKVKTKPERQEELPWDLLDRCLLPIIFSHAAAVIISTVLNTLYISQVSSFSLFLLFMICSLAAVLFYHHLKVSAAGKAVLITSCESKLGAALAKQLDDLGFTVFAGFPGKNNEKAEKLKEVTSGRLHVVELDVTNERQVEAAAAYVRRNLPGKSEGLWALVSLAQSAAFGEVEWVPRGVFRKAVEVNLLSVINITQVFLPMLRKSKGRVVNVTSILGRISSPVRAPFCATTFAIEGFSDCLRLEMRRWGVDVVVVEPGDYTTGNLWFNDSRMLDEARNMWKEMPNQTKEDYGMDYFEYKVRTLQEYTRGPATDLVAVVRSLTDAVCRTFPLARYTPVTREEKMRAFVSDHFPRSVYDILYN